LEKIAIIAIFFLKNLKKIFTQFKTLFDVSNRIFGLQSFHFRQKLCGLSVFRKFKSSKRALASFLTVKKTKNIVGF
jgi:hypothetical protein